jgi:hypothetical protein
LLEKAQTIDEPGKNASLKHTLLITGRDGYAVALALSGFLAKGRSSRSPWRRRHALPACLPP